MMNQVGPGGEVAGPDTVDKNDPAIVEGIGENDKYGLPADLEHFQGYSQLGDIIPPPPVATSAIPEKATYKEPEIQSVPVISEATAKQALLDHVDAQCCWGKKTANGITTFTQLDSTTSYQYVLETFTETRAPQWDFEPFRGQLVDGPQNGPAPLPWDIPLYACENFRDYEVRAMEIPHTAFVRGCHRCRGYGYLVCSGCEGRGRLYCGMCKGKGRRHMRFKDSQGVFRAGQHNCDVCSGTGKKPCQRCSGSARVTCPACLGHKQVKWFLKLQVMWKTYKTEFVAGKANVSQVLVSRVPGTVIFQDEHPMLLPVTHCDEPSVVSASARMIVEQKTQYPHARIIAQRHRIKVVPVTQCFFQSNNKPLSYYVYGLDCRVYAPDYPEQTCFGCEIM